ncbi:hypothetical protein [Inquilinus sp. CAU 1745]
MSLEVSLPAVDRLTGLSRRSFLFIEVSLEFPASARKTININ